MSLNMQNGTGAMKLTIIRSFFAPFFIFFYVNPPLFINSSGVSYSLEPVISKIFALVMVLLVMLTDYLDGKIARKYNQVSDLGKILDPFSDAMFFVVFYTTLACVPPYWMTFWLALPIVLRELIQHTFIRTYAMKKGIALAAKYSGKFKTALSCFGALYVLVIDIVFASTKDLTPFMKTSAFWVLFVVSSVYFLSLFDYIAAILKIRKEN